MKNKQKLPKHITAYESLTGSGIPSNVFVLLRSAKTNKYYSVVKSNPESIRKGIFRLDVGKGWGKDKAVGKQIVF